MARTGTASSRLDFGAICRSSRARHPVIVILGCLLAGVLFQAPQAAAAELSPELTSIFEYLDELGRARISKARFVQVTFVFPWRPKEEISKFAWVVSENDESVSLLLDDLLPWKVHKKAPTQIPGDFAPYSIVLKSIQPADFDRVCNDICQAAAAVKEPGARRRRVPEPELPCHTQLSSLRRNTLMAHAAWKKGSVQFCQALISAEFDPDLDGAKGADAWRETFLRELGHSHFMRALNLLRSADRAEVVMHLRLALKLAPDAHFAAMAGDLEARLATLAVRGKRENAIHQNESDIAEPERVALYISQLVDLRCPPTMEIMGAAHVDPFCGINPNATRHDTWSTANIPTCKLLDLDILAVSALINALEDDTPTRTVCTAERVGITYDVWRVSDFAAAVLRRITDGYGPAPMRESPHSEPFSRASAAQRRTETSRMRQWYADNRHATRESRMFERLRQNDPEVWLRAGRYFSDRNDTRATSALCEKFLTVPERYRDELYDLVAKFGDPNGKRFLQHVVAGEGAHSQKLHAAIALWQMNDNSGIGVALEYLQVKFLECDTDAELTWFLLDSHTPDGMDALRAIIDNGPADRVGYLLSSIEDAIINRWGSRATVGCTEVCPVLAGAMNRKEYTNLSNGDIRLRCKDIAAKSFALLKNGWDHRDPFGASTEFDEDEPNECIRDEQIEALLTWYVKYRDRMRWDATAQQLVAEP
jgi:hypothetical protein